MVKQLFNNNYHLVGRRTFCPLSHHGSLKALCNSFCASKNRQGCCIWNLKKNMLLSACQQYPTFCIFFTFYKKATMSQNFVFRNANISLPSLFLCTLENCCLLELCSKLVKNAVFGGISNLKVEVKQQVPILFVITIY